MAVVVATGYPLTALATADPATPEAIVSEQATVPEETNTSSPETTGADGTQTQGEPAAEATQQPPVSQSPSTPPASEAPVVPEVPVQTSTTTPTPVSPDSTARQESQPSAPSRVTQRSAIDATNNLTSKAQTGNTSVSTNTTGGNAASGDAAASTTLINTVHSTIQGDTEGVAHFTADIHGNVVGDITLAPVLNAAMANPSNTPSTTTTVQSDQATSLTNNISLNATSGNADVSNNTTAGNATTGTADTVANIVNLINTIIAANKSFVGTINIYGNLDGDILVSSDFIPQLLASNATGIPGVNGTPSILSVEDTQAIVNNVTLDAASGDASVLNNTTAGSATTGQAKTNLTILNYAGHDVVASNSLLIFVNVLGTWVGVIVDAPAGATAAVLGNGVTSNTANGQAVNASATNAITNNVDLTSRSGDATVQGNTQAGNATSGDATASANIANISSSVFSVSDWFGILFINVFGTWYGSFGVNTANGTVVPISDGVIPLAEIPQLPVPLAPKTTRPAPSAMRFGFTPRNDTPASTNVSPVATDSEIVAEESAAEGPVASLASVLSSPQALTGQRTQSGADTNTSSLNIPLGLMAIAGLLGATLIATASLRQK
jgi:hypothetical protein